jgi:long-chain fatty acid transport protein
MKTCRRLFALTPLCALFAAGSVYATNGYFSHGYGIKASGMGGATTALAQDSMGGATNPASMVWAGDRIDVGLVAFMPKRDSERSGAGFPTLNGKVDSDNTLFWVPEFGYNRMINSDMSLGVSVYGNGGLNTTYPQGTFNCGGPAANILCGGGSIGVDLSQLILAPTVAYKLNAQHAVGLSLLLGYQQFKAFGLQAFDNPGAPIPNFTGAPGSVTNNGYEKSTGVGLRVGYQGRLSDSVTIGAAYAPKMKMGKLDKYKGLFAGNGSFDIPSNYFIGVAFMPTPAWTLALDLGRINYSDVASVSNPSAPLAPLGAANGPGFGWKDINVVKIGVAWRMSETLTLRAGYNKGDNPITSADVTFNILAPGVMKDHYTAGFTYALDKGSEISGMVMVAPRQTVTGSSLFNSLFGPGAGGNETIGMKQTSIGLAWGRKF